MSAPIDLRTAAFAWNIDVGTVHVFAVPQRAGLQMAPRRFLFSLSAPALLLPVPDGPASMGLLAVPMADAVVVPAEEAYADATRLEGWIGGWCSAGARLLAGRPPRGLRVVPDGEMRLPAGAVLDAADAITWCRVLDGTGAWFDSESLDPDGLALVPLAAGAWLRGFDALHLATCRTTDLLDSGRIGAALAGFTQAVQRQVAGALNLALVDETQRRSRRDGRAAEDMRRVLGDLGRMIGHVAPQRALPAANQTIFHAVHALAGRIGVRAMLPPSVRRAEADAEVGLEAILAASGLRARTVTLPQDWHIRSLGDLLLRDAESGAYLALLAERGGYVIEDPTAGTRTRVTGAVAARIAPTAQVLYEPLPDAKLTILQLSAFGLRGSGGDMLAIVAAAILSAWAASLPALASQFILQDLIPQHLATLLLQAGIGLALIGLLRAAVGYSGAIAFARLRARASASLKAAIWDRVLRQPMGFLGRYAAPDLALRCNTAEQIVQAVHQLAQQSMVAVAMLLINLGTILWLSRLAGFAAIGLMGIYAAAIWLAFVGQKNAFRQGEAAEGSVSVFIHALTNGIRKLRLAGAEDRAFVKWGERFSRSRARLIGVRRVTNRFLTFAAGFDLAALAAVLALLALLGREKLEVGMLFGIVVAFGVTVSSMASLGRAVTAVAFQFASVPYVQPLLDAPPPREAKKASPGLLSGAVTLAGVHFRYGEGEPVLNGLDLDIRAGEFVAIVGASGSGKSTIAKLLLGLERPAGGAVLYDGRDLDGLDAGAVRRQIGTVLQRIDLAPGSLFDCIRGITDATEAQVWQAVATAGLADDIAAMPMRLQTLVAEGGHGFSGGQIQRVAIARAVLGQPALLLLDEATSALDNTTQAEIAANLTRLACTRIVIAHRLSTIRQAERIVVLDRGQVAEEGSFDALCAKGGLFAAMVERQTA